jgi:hypothetical protein
MFLPHFIVIAGNNKGVKGTMKVSGTVSRCNWRIRFLTPLFSLMNPLLLQRTCDLLNTETEH